MIAKPSCGRCVFVAIVIGTIVASCGLSSFLFAGGSANRSMSGVSAAGALASQDLGLSLARVLHSPTPEENAAFGRSLVAADVNGDGVDDLIVGSPLQDVHGATDAGEVSVFLGPTISAGPSTCDPSPEAGAHFGESLATGEFDADGNLDMTVGAPQSDGRFADAGEVFVFFGPDFITRKE